MESILLVALIIPIVFAFLDLGRDYYPFHVGVSGGCALLLLLSAGRLHHLALVAGLICSMAGDWFLHNKSRDERFYLFGIGGFLLAHCCYLIHILNRYQANNTVLIIGLLLLIGYGLFVAKRILPNVSGVPMKTAVSAYALISVLVLALSFGFQGTFSERLLFTLGIACIVLSDTIIAESDFGGNRRFARWIMPTYYACHVLITAGALAAGL